MSVWKWFYAINRFRIWYITSGAIKALVENNNKKRFV